MLDQLVKFFTWLFKLWKQIPEDTRDVIIEKISDEFEKIFRAFYKATKS